MQINSLVPMCAVREGDFLVDLDNGYVVEVESDETVRLTFHDAEGNECYLETGGSHPIKISRTV